MLSAAVPHILIVEDDPAIRQAVEAVLQSAGYGVDCAGDGLTALQAARGLKPDLIILDIRLPTGPDGLMVARHLRQTGDIPIIFLTAMIGLQAHLSGFDAGADDYIEKPFSMDELLARVRAVLRRTTEGAEPGVLRLNGLILDEQARQVSKDGTEIHLTSTEFRLLSTLLRHRGQVLAKDHLLRQVWGYDAYSPNLVEAHISALRRKLEAHGARIIHTVRGAGYTLRI